MAEGKVVIVALRERGARGIWKSPEQGEKRGLNTVSRMDQALKGEGTGEGVEEDWGGGIRECLAEMRS